MEAIMIYILGILFFTLIWWIASGFIHLGFKQFGIWDKVCIRTKKKIHPKYTTKVDPIFELFEDYWGSGMYVRKWELRYGTKENTQFLLSIIPYPIEILYYQYIKVDSFYMCEKDDVEKVTSKYTLEEFFEEKLREQDLKRVEKQKKENTIELLNKTFKENYE